MTRILKPLLLALALIVADAAAADWTPIADGVDYQRFTERGFDIHVARIDLTRGDLRLVATRESERGLRVSDFAKRTHALVAINAGYFDKNLKPVGLTVSPCGQWPGSRDTRWGAVVAVGEENVSILRESETIDVAEPWIRSAVSGWPTLVRECHARRANELPGSKAFTHAPHARSAIGVSADGKLVYLVVVEGGRKELPGMTLAQLAAWMREELAVCEALNLDGGGSSALWVEDRIVNRPSDGTERRVGDHLAVVRAEDVLECAPVPSVSGGLTNLPPR